MPTPEAAENTISRISPHSHLCMIYKSEAERISALATYIKSGLDLGERVLYIANTKPSSQLLQKLDELGVSKSQIEKNHSLQFREAREAYLDQNGNFDADRMIKLIKHASDQAIADGFKGLRGSGEMDWALENHPGVEQLLDYEAKLNQFITENRFTGLCQYRAEAFPPEILRGVLMTHPTIVFRRLVLANFYYLPPEEYFDHRFTPAEIDNWLDGLQLFERQAGVESNPEVAAAHIKVAEFLRPIVLA